MKDDPGVVVHLVELIDTTYASIRENESTTFKDKLASLGVFSDVNRQTDG